MPVDVFPEFTRRWWKFRPKPSDFPPPKSNPRSPLRWRQDLLNGVAWLDAICSESVPGLSRILLVFEPGTDPIRARQMVEERLTQAMRAKRVETAGQMLQPL